MDFYKLHDLLMVGDDRLGKGAEKTKDFPSPDKVPAGQFADDEWMAEDFPSFKQGLEPGIIRPKEFDPDRGVGQNHD